MAKGGARKRSVSDETASMASSVRAGHRHRLGRLAAVLGSGGGMKCWRRLRDWNAAGVWQKLHHAMLVRLREHDQIDWSRASIDGSSVPSPRGAQERGADVRAEHGRLQPGAHAFAGTSASAGRQMSATGVLNGTRAASIERQEHIQPFNAEQATEFTPSPTQNCVRTLGISAAC
ncbi:hypothetical protein [Acidovorax sacchari]|uniref:hypothetical protein n=1 Tax=Acidovorax sacchari TaxID=3230736 RepID=UPI0039E3A3A8